MKHIRTHFNRVNIKHELHIRVGNVIGLPVYLMHCHCFRIGFHFQKEEKGNKMSVWKHSREIFMEHTRTHTQFECAFVRGRWLARMLSSFLSNHFESNASCSNIFLCYFNSEHKILHNCKKWHTRTHKFIHLYAY